MKYPPFYLPRQNWMLVIDHNQTAPLVALGELIDDEERAFIAYLDETQHGDVCRVFCLEFEVDTQRPETFREVTEDFQTRKEAEAEQSAREAVEDAAHWRIEGAKRRFV